MKYLEKIKDLLKKIYTDYIKKYGYIFLIFLPFLLMDIIIRSFGNGTNLYKVWNIIPNLFTITWACLFIGISLSLKSKIGKWVYLGVNILFLIMFLTNGIYYSMTHNFFDFILLESTSEGAPYMMDCIKNCNIWIYIWFVIIIFTIYVGFRKIPKKDNFNYKNVIIVVLIFLLIHLLLPNLYGSANSSLEWNTWQNPRNIYKNFNDANKSMSITGLYEYTIRNFYITFLQTEEEETSEDYEFLMEAFSVNNNEVNKYTGIFKNKNLIFVQLEGIDDWLLTEKDMPTLYGMLNNSFVFQNHYSYYNGGGSTFNSEFAVNTGFITPLSYTQNAYSFNKNSFPYSMANMFKNQDYVVNAFHMNSGEYYSRQTNYSNWGYDKYYGLLDINDYKDKSYTLDRELINDVTFQERMFPKDSKFVDYLITYSNHLPFTNTKGVCKLLYDMEMDLDDTVDMGEESSSMFVQLTEEECIRKQAHETDYMMELLLKKLTELNLIDDTVIVVFTDHYLYTVEDKTILDKYKNTSNNLINKTPFFIWQNNMKRTNIKEVTSQLNILPTTLNLFGINYNPNYYIGSDALSSNYKGIVFFSDYSWYDGNIYVDNGVIANNKSSSQEYLDEKNYYIHYLTKKNDLALKYNVFKKST
ncbi:MAG: LTA synthase family protein [Bacilli bacterium]|nr:LTA synthase family protein [Bacilli bacterium]